MRVRRFLTVLSGLLGCIAAAYAFRIFPVDISTPVTWLWIPLLGGTVFINCFGLAAITLMVPWEIITHYSAARTELKVLEGKSDITLDKTATTGPAVSCKRIA